MKLTFRINAESQGEVVPADADAFRALMQGSPIIAADYLKDMLFDLQGLYNEARAACGFSEMEFPFP